MTTDDDTPAAAILGGPFASVTANVGATSVGTSTSEWEKNLLTTTISRLATTTTTLCLIRWFTTAEDRFCRSTGAPARPCLPSILDRE